MLTDVGNTSQSHVILILYVLCPQNHAASDSLKVCHNILPDGFGFWLDLWIVVYYDIHPVYPGS